MRPLYTTSLTPNMARPAGAHAGLWYDKFCTWSVDATKGYAVDKAWVRDAAKGPVGDADLLAEHVERRRGLLARLGGRAICVKTAGRFVTGLGYRHPIENGFAWHPTLGTPFLAGSGLKGVTRAWATLEGVADEEIRRIFGPRDEADHHAGSVLFLEAIPTRPVSLAAEVMTPHHQEYHQRPVPEAPGDYQDPNPIPFLAVESGTPFLAGLLPRSQAPEHLADMDKAAGWLLGALEWIGAGAKTAAGYGRFEADAEGERAWQAFTRKLEEERARRELEERLRTGGPIERMRHLVAGLSEGKLYDQVRELLVKGGLADPAEQDAFRQAVRETKYFAAWQKGRAVGALSAGKDKLKEMARHIAGAPES